MASSVIHRNSDILTVKESHFYSYFIFILKIGNCIVFNLLHIQVEADRVVSMWNKERFTYLEEDF